jgi:hypothetical protein
VLARFQRIIDFAGYSAGAVYIEKVQSNDSSDTDV